MKSKIIREIRLAIFAWLIVLAMKFLPSDCMDTYGWLSRMPFEE